MPKEDEAVFTGRGIVYSYDEATKKETKLSDAFSNVRVVFKEDGIFGITHEGYFLIDTGGWMSMNGWYGTYKISNNLLSFSMTSGQDNTATVDFFYSYQGTTLILKLKQVDESGVRVALILSSETITPLIPQTVFPIVLPS